ncbi:MAG: nuclear transport factor 2 family protein [Acidimicrobiales bacterium]
MGSPDAVDVALAYVASFAGRDPDQIASHVTEDFVNEHTAALGSGCVGRAEYRHRLPAFLADFEGLLYEPEDVVAQGDRVVVAYRMTATYHGKPIDLRGVFRLRIARGQVTHRVDYWDALTFLRQIGEA